MKPLSDSSSKGKDQKSKPYETPAIIYEGTITTRAGSGGEGPIAPPDDNKVNPEDLFG